MKMDKNTLLWILQATLLAFDGTTEKIMIEIYNIDPEIARKGIKLCEYIETLKNHV